MRLARRASEAQPEVTELVSELLGHPSAHFLRRLVIGPLGADEEFNYIGVVEAIARRGHARLEELLLGDFAPGEMELAFSRAGNVAPLLGALPALQRLKLRAGSLRFESAVRHPALPNDAGHTIWKRDFTGASGLFGVVLKPYAKASVDAFLDSLELFGMGYSWGGYESLLIPTHPETCRTAVAWPGGCTPMRIHVGLEDPDDLIRDLEAGFQRLQAG